MSLDYRPDIPFSPNILYTATFLIPDKAGNYRTSFSAASAGWTGALSGSSASNIVGSRMVQFSDGTPNVFFGNTTKLIELTGAGASDVSRLVGGAYATGSNRWWFCQFGDSTIASNYADATQVRTSSVVGTKFADLSGAPKAKFFLSQRGYLLAFNYNDGSAVPNGVKWATQGSTTTWTPAAGNTAGNAVLRETPGAVIAGAEIHDVVVAWKRNSMYIGRIVGGAGTDVWRFDLLSPKIGCVSQEAWVATPVGIIFVSPNNGVYKFDGSVPVPIDRGIRSELYRNIGRATNMMLSHDEASQCVFFWNGTLCYAYNYASDKWSVAYAGSLGNASFTTVTAVVRDANYDDMITLSGGSAANSRCHLVVTTEREVANLATHSAGTGINASYSVLNLRDPKAAPDMLTKLSRVTPIHAFNAEDGFYDGEPASGTMLVGVSPRIGSSVASSSSVSMSALRRYDCLVTGNTLALTFSHTAQTMILQDLVFDTDLAGVA